MYLVSILIGLVIVISSLFLMRREFNRAIRSQSLLLDQSSLYKDSDLFEILESLQSSIDGMNQAFYDIANDLEGKYSIQSKELELLQEKSQAQEMILNTLSAKIKKNHLDNSVISGSFSDVNPLSRVKNINSSPENTVDDINSTKDIKTHVNDLNEIRKNQARLKDITIDNTDEEQDLLEKITTLRSQGYTLNQIAKELEIGMGEIQLLIQLKK